MFFLEPAFQGQLTLHCWLYLCHHPLHQVVKLKDWILSVVPLWKSSVIEGMDSVWCIALYKFLMTTPLSGMFTGRILTSTVLIYPWLVYVCMFVYMSLCCLNFKHNWHYIASNYRKNQQCMLQIEDKEYAVLSKSVYKAVTDSKAVPLHGTLVFKQEVTITYRDEMKYLYA